jgi:hypothetical protein
MLRIPEDSRAPRRTIVSAGNHKNIGTFRLNLHLSSGSRMDMSLQRKLSSANCQGLAAEFSKLHIAQRALAVRGRQTALLQPPAIRGKLRTYTF